MTKQDALTAMERPNRQREAEFQMVPAPCRAGRLLPRWYARLGDVRAAHQTRRPSRGGGGVS